MPEVLCFGEVLWDCLPQGRFPGGAPFNVACHLQRFGITAHLLTAVGEDPLGTELCQEIEQSGLSLETVARHYDWPTGTVEVALSDTGQPAYHIHENVAWDRIPLGPSVARLLPRLDALVFGSLAWRSMKNRMTLGILLQTEGILKVFDVNLRPPFDDLERVHELAGQCDVLKLNDIELKRLLDSSDATADLEASLRTLAAMTETATVCVTLGAEGAALLHADRFWRCQGTTVEVKDTVGAGDAFLASLLASLLSGRLAADPQPTLHRACKVGAYVASCEGACPLYDAEKILTDG